MNFKRFKCKNFLYAGKKQIRNITVYVSHFYNPPNLKNKSEFPTKKRGKKIQHSILNFILFLFYIVITKQNIFQKILVQCKKVNNISYIPRIYPYINTYKVYGKKPILQFFISKIILQFVSAIRDKIHTFTTYVYVYTLKHIIFIHNPTYLYLTQSIKVLCSIIKNENKTTNSQYSLLFNKPIVYLNQLKQTMPKVYINSYLVYPLYITVFHIVQGMSSINYL
eukprot:TRINITY_DN10974_c0_g1_i19.p1 TRINITY_DN10974_c0_g1~~TRINITY_DN10974_c0_g1_i19.p1  ORF type:complete len:223 (+),score=-34.07 TRINITY_DN10974_c0_g1_i19:371-1039(+)